jgi:hypothetical protein
MELTASDLLNQAALLLEQENIFKWGRGTFFRPTPEGGCAACAHGAIDYCASPLIRKRIADGMRHAQQIYRYGGDTWDGFYDNTKAADQAHLKARKVGLTYDFNDERGRTKEEVIAKLREAAALYE